MDAGNLLKARVARLLTGPVEQRQVHHAVDDGIARALTMRPRADEALGVEAPGQNRRGMQGVGARLRVAGETEMRAGGEQIHEAHVVIKQIEAPELVRQQLLHAQRLGHVDRLARRLVQLPHDGRPEAAGPPAIAVVGGGEVAPLPARIGDDSLLCGELCAARKLARRALKGRISPICHNQAPP